MLTDAHAGEHRRASTNPRIFFHQNRLALQNRAVIQIVIIRKQLHVGSNPRTVFNRDASAGHHQQVAADIDVLPDFHMFKTYALQRRREHGPLADVLAEQILDHCGVFLGHGHGVVQLENELGVTRPDFVGLRVRDSGIHDFFFAIHYFLAFFAVLCRFCASFAPVLRRRNIRLLFL